jgi:hypothetical protein
MAHLSDPEALAYSQEHVYYEIEMLFLIGQLLDRASAPTSPREQVVFNALVQSFAIHLRNLIMFLYPDRVYPTDVLATDFVADLGAWQRNLPAISGTLKDAKTRAHKEVAHLSTERIAGTPPDKAWDGPGLIAEIKALLDNFVQHASPNRLAPKIAAFLKAPPRI